MVRVASLPSVANRYISLTPGPNNAPEIPEGGVISVDETHQRGRPRPALQHARPEDPQGPSEACCRASRPGTRARARTSAQTFKYFGPSLQSFAPGDGGDRPRPGGVHRPGRERRARGQRDRLAPRRPRRPGHERERVRARARLRERVARPCARASSRRRCAQGSTTFTNLRSALEDLNRLTDVSKPAIKGPGAVPAATCADLFKDDAQPAFEDFRYIVRNPGPANDATDQMRQMPALERLARTNIARTRSQALKQSQHVIEFLRPYAPDMAAWIAHFAQVPGLLRRERPLRARAADLQRLLVRPGRQPAEPAGPRRARHDRSPDGATASARARRRSPRRTARTRSSTTASSAPTTATRQRGRPDHESRRIMRQRIVIAVVAVAVLVAAGRRDGRGWRRTTTATTRCARSSTTRSFLIPGEDVKVAGAKVGEVDDARGHRRPARGGRARDHEPGFKDFRKDAECADPAAVGDRREARRVHADPAARRGRGSASAAARRSPTASPARASTCCRSSNTITPVGEDLIRNVMRLPYRAALRDHPERVRRRPRGPRQGPAQGDPRREPGAARARQRARDPGRAEQAARATASTAGDRVLAEWARKAQAGRRLDRAGATSPRRRRPSGAPTSSGTSSCSPSSCAELTPTMVRARRSCRRR